MPVGGGKYDAECTQARESTEAKAIVLIVIAGNKGSGFSVQSVAEVPPKVLSELLHDIANEIARSGTD